MNSLMPIMSAALGCCAALAGAQTQGEGSKMASSFGQMRQLTGTELRARFAGIVLRYLDRDVSPAAWERFNADGLYLAQLHRVSVEGTYTIEQDAVCVQSPAPMPIRRCRRAYIDSSGSLQVEGPLDGQGAMPVAITQI